MRVAEAEVGRILQLIASEPGRRDRPREGDLQGTFDYWFDGGAVSMLTGTIRYHFVGETVAFRDVSPFTLSVTIVFKNGSRVIVSQR